MKKYFRLIALLTILAAVGYAGWLVYDTRTTNAAAIDQGRQTRSAAEDVMNALQR